MPIVSTHEGQTFRATTSSYLVLGGVFGGIFAFMLYATLFTHESFWKGALTAGLLLLVVLVWLARFEIQITSDELTFRSLFGGVRRIRAGDIRLVRLGFDLRSTGGPLRLLVEPIRRDLPQLSINAKVFSQAAIRAVLDFGKHVAAADSGDLEDGVVARTIRRRSRKDEEA